MEKENPKINFIEEAADKYLTDNELYGESAISKLCATPFSLCADKAFKAGWNANPAKYTEQEFIEANQRHWQLGHDAATSMKGFFNGVWTDEELEDFHEFCRDNPNKTSQQLLNEYKSLKYK